MADPSEAEIAWAAGFFEGEGYFSSITRQLKDGPRLYPNVGLKNTDLAMLERFHRIVGVGKIVDAYSGERKRQPHHKDAWRWRVTSRLEAEHVLHLLKPWLSPRRIERAEEVFDDRGLLKKPKTHCPRGHPYSPENTYQWKNYRWCRACKAEKKEARLVKV